MKSLLHLINLINNMEEGANVDTVYLDFSKAFDKVDNGILMHKMRDLGFHGSLAIWIYNFLSERKYWLRMEPNLELQR